MKSRTLMAAMAVMISACIFSACGKEKDAGQDQAADTPTPSPVVSQEAQAPSATPTPAVTQDIPYTSKDQKISISLPDSTWTSQTDADGQLNFVSPEQGRIDIAYTSSEEGDSVDVPYNEEIAASVLSDQGLEEGIDYEIKDFKSSVVNDLNLYQYTVKALDIEKCQFVYEENYVITDWNEMYLVTGTATATDMAMFKQVQESVLSFRILDENSSLKAATDAIQEQGNGIMGDDENSESQTDSSYSDSSYSSTSDDSSHSGSGSSDWSGGSSDNGSSHDSDWSGNSDDENWDGGSSEGSGSSDDGSSDDGSWDGGSSEGSGNSDDGSSDDGDGDGGSSDGSGSTDDGSSDDGSSDSGYDDEVAYEE